MDRWNADFDRETTLDEFILEERPDEPPDEPPDDPEPLSNPPQDHRLFTDLYDSLEDLIDELRYWAASAGFGICKQRSNNYIRGFGPTRIDITCDRGSMRLSRSYGSRQTSTSKCGCSWQVVAKALAEDNRAWSLHQKALESGG